MLIPLEPSAITPKPQDIMRTTGSQDCGKISRPFSESSCMRNSIVVDMKMVLTANPVDKAWNFLMEKRI